MSSQYSHCDQIVKAVDFHLLHVFLKYKYKDFWKRAEFCATKTSKEFFFLSLTLLAKCCVIGRRWSASWQSLYYPRTTMSQPVDIKSLSESTKEYFSRRKSVMTHVMLNSCQSRTFTTYLCYVLLFYFWTKKLPLESKSRHKNPQIIELGIQLRLCNGIKIIAVSPRKCIWIIKCLRISLHQMELIIPRSWFMDFRMHTVYNSNFLWANFFCQKNPYFIKESILSIYDFLTACSLELLFFHSFFIICIFLVQIQKMW